MGKRTKNTELARRIGKLSRENLQQAIQRALLADDVDVKEFRQLVCLDIAQELQATVLLDLDDRARNFNNPARLAQTYKEMRLLLRDSDDEESEGDDGWGDLLDDAADDAVTETGTFLELVQREESKTSRDENEQPSSSEETPSKGFKTAVSSGIVRELIDRMKGVHNKTHLAKEFNLSRATLVRYYRKHLIEGAKLPD